MAIDLNNQEQLKKLSLDDLINDAVERKDKKALEWLENESKSMTTRKRKDGTTYEVSKSIIEIRANYLKLFLGYEPKGKKAAAEQRAKKRKEKREQIAKKFEEAYEKIK